MRKQKGFSLIELLVVVAIILIIAAIAIPNLLRARTAANEASAVGSVRAMNTAEMTYFTTYGIGFAPMGNLGGTPVSCATATGATASGACLLDNTLVNTGIKSGYSISTPTPTAVGTLAAPNSVYTVLAVPVTVGQTGSRAFCSDQSGTIHMNANGTSCTAADNVLQ